MWDSFFDSASDIARFFMCGHSQGVIHIRNALKTYPEERRKRIQIVAIAPGGYIDEELALGGVIHYRAKYDLVPRLDRSGAKKAKYTTFTLPSHPDTKFSMIGDHTFMSPTYTRVLRQEISDFINS